MNHEPVRQCISSDINCISFALDKVHAFGAGVERRFDSVFATTGGVTISRSQTTWRCVIVMSWLVMGVRLSPAVFGKEISQISNKFPGGATCRS